MVPPFRTSQPSAETASATSAPCPTGFTFSNTRAMRPVSSMTKVVRFTPMYFFPNIDFCAHTPYASHTAWSVSATSGYASPYFALNFSCFFAVSGLTPMTVASIPSNRGRACWKLHASMVQPGVSSLG